MILYCLAPNCLWRYSPTVVPALGSPRGRLDNPICRAGKRHVWGTKAKLPVTHLAGGFAIFEAALLCWSSLREKSICSQMLPRLTSKGRESSPIRPKDANFGLDLLGRRGLLFCLMRVVSENLMPGIILRSLSATSCKDHWLPAATINKQKRIRAANKRKPPL